MNTLDKKPNAFISPSAHELAHGYVLATTTLEYERKQWDAILAEKEDEWTKERKTYEQQIELLKLQIKGLEESKAIVTDRVSVRKKDL